MSSCPTGNGEVRGPESAGPMGTPLPGTRPSRAAANNARHRDFLRETVVADQAGFGKEDMERTPMYMGDPMIRPSDSSENTAPDLAAMGDGGQPFGGS